MLDIFIETIIDSIKLLPFLFLAYLLIEYIEHNHSEKIKKILSKSGKVGPFIGSLLGIVPQCGFSAAASSLYAGRVITIGTLFSVFIATSDEAIPIMLSNPESYPLMIKLIIFKFIIALVIGTTIDIIAKRFFNKGNQEEKDHEHIHEMCHDCDCEHGILKSTVKHTLNIFTFIFIFSLVLNFVIFLIGEESLSKVLLSGSVLGPVISALIGLIPNCAASVILTELYVSNTISFGAVLAGLCSNAGIGMIVLFKTNKDSKENVKILVSTFLIASVIGILVQLLGV